MSTCSFICCLRLLDGPSQQFQETLFRYFNSIEKPIWHFTLVRPKKKDSPLILGLIEYCCNQFKGLTQKFVWFVVISSMNSVLKIGRCWYVQLLGFFLAKHSRNPEIKERTLLADHSGVSQINKVKIKEWNKDYVQFSTFSYNILTQNRYLLMLMNAVCVLR